MKKLTAYFLMAFIILMARDGIAQLAINIDGSAPDPSSILDITSTNKGLLIPRMTSAEVAAIESPAEGLMIYQTDSAGNGEGFYFYHNTEWEYIANTHKSLSKKIVLVKTVDDFPEPVAGVIQLADSISYHIDGNVNIGSNSINMGAGNAFLGNDNLVDKLIYTGSGAMFTSLNRNFSIRFITMSATAAGSQLFNITSGVSNKVHLQNNMFENNKDIGYFDGAYSIIVDDNVFLNNEQGIEIRGDVGRFAFRDNLIDSIASGTSLSIPSGNFGIIQIKGNYFNVDAGDTAINISTGLNLEQGIISLNLLHGDGTYMVGIESSIVGWIFDANFGIKDSDAVGFCRFLGNTTQTIISSEYPVFNKASGTNDTAYGERFTYSENNRLTYVGLNEINGKFILSGNIEVSSPNQNLYVAVFKNGMTNLEQVQVRAASTNQPYIMTLNGSASMQTNDYLEVWVSNSTSTANITISDFQFRVNK